MHYLFLLLVFIFCGNVMPLKALQSEIIQQSAKKAGASPISVKSKSLYVVALTWFPPLPTGNLEAKKQGLEQMTVENIQWIKWPMLTCIKVDLKEGSVLQQLYTPGKKISVEIGFPITTADKKTITHKGALLLEIAEVFDNYKDFVAGYTRIHPTPSGSLITIFLNFTPPDTSLQEKAKKENITLVPITTTSKVQEGWSLEMKEESIKLLRRILS